MKDFNKIFMIFYLKLEKKMKKKKHLKLIKFLIKYFDKLKMMKNLNLE